LLGSNWVKTCQAISLPNISRFFVATNHIEAWGRATQNQDGIYSTDKTFMPFPNWLALADIAQQALINLVADLPEFTAH